MRPLNSTAQTDADPQFYSITVRGAYAPHYESASPMPTLWSAM